MNPVEPLTLEVSHDALGILRNDPGGSRFVVEVQFEVETALWMYQLIP